MDLLRRLRASWRGFWGRDLGWPMEHDSHPWANQVEVRRRLGSSPRSHSTKPAPEGARATTLQMAA
ncbi:MAG: hypothetical protein MUC88_10190 [Planctomycetes bacterium]|jgi:hypothetical protein|nr:hypothetical protein [Planctomycetota bacterium]